MEVEDDSTFIPLRIIHTWWKSLVAYSWSIFITYELAIGFNYFEANQPICPYKDVISNSYYINIMYFILGGFFMILASIIVRFLTTNENDSNKYFLYWISLHIITISTISTFITTLYNWGGVCIDSLGVASSAAVWGEWIACSPFILFIATTMTNNDDRIHKKDILISLSFVISLLLGFSIIYTSKIVGIFVFCFSVLLSIPGIFISIYYKVEQENIIRIVNLYKQYKYISRSIFLIFPLYLVNYLLSVIQLYPYWITIVVYQLLSLLTKGLFVSFIMDIHLNVLIDIDKALMREKLANETRRSFMKYIFHEVRTPLNSLSIGIDYLIETAVGDNKQTLESMQSSCLYMNETLNNVLNLHKIEEHKWEVENRPFCFKEMIHRIQSTFSSVMSSKKINFVYHVIDDIIISDPIKIKHIITNLVSNAIKFTKSNGCITVKIEKNKERNAIVIWVKDTGCGISAEHQQTLFMNFSQIRPATIQEGGGSGLGLMYCKQITNLLHGTIGIKYSGQNIGTVFECIIPVQFKQPVVEIAPTSITLSSLFPQLDEKEVLYPTSSICVLVVDDHEASRKIFSMYLKKIGMDIICCAEDGLIGLDLVQKNRDRFNLLIVDNLMPNMSGVEMTRRLREGGYPYLIIGLTGNVMEQDMIEFSNAGADHVLMKPVSMKDVMGLIRFINQHGVTSKTNDSTKLVLNDHQFYWITVTPLLLK
jgi:signal transduction histidine kinase/CheY-like chemotaxis protein